MYNDKFVKALLIGAFLLIILMTIPFLIAEKPEEQAKIDETVLKHPAVSKEAQQQASAPAKPGSNIPAADTGSYAQHHQYGLNYYKQGSYQAAIAMFQEALKAKPGSSVDLYYIAVCQSRLGMYDDAETSFSIAESAYQNSATYWYTRALNAENISTDYYLEKAQTYINYAYEKKNTVPEKTLVIVKKRAEILLAAYEAYKREQNLRDGAPALEKHLLKVIRAYSELESFAYATRRDNISQHAKTQVKYLRNIYNSYYLPNAQSPQPQTQAAGMASNKNTGANNADIQLIENLPTME